MMNLLDEQSLNIITESEGTRLWKGFVTFVSVNAGSSLHSSHIHNRTAHQTNHQYNHTRIRLAPHFAPHYAPHLWMRHSSSSRNVEFCHSPSPSIKPANQSRWDKVIGTKNSNNLKSFQRQKNRATSFSLLENHHFAYNII